MPQTFLTRKTSLFLSLFIIAVSGFVFPVKSLDQSSRGSLLFHSSGLGVGSQFQTSMEVVPPGGSTQDWEPVKDDKANAGHLYGYGVENHQPSILQNITAQRRQDVIEAKKNLPEEQLIQEAAKFEQKYGEPLNLDFRIREEEPEMAIAAEFKRASPSKGDINTDLVAYEQGLKYASVGAAVLSVLTEPTWFKGSLQDMKEVREKTQSIYGGLRPAVLRKDFIVDRYQILEARANGADTVLLIVAILEVNTLYELLVFSRSIGMEPLVEVHTPQEMDIALDVGAKVIGVNNRNLHNFELDLATTEKCAAAAAKRGFSWGAGGDIVLCSLSGISSSDDVERYRDVGVSMVLVGEALMRASDPKHAIQQLMGKVPSVDPTPSHMEDEKETEAVTRVGYKDSIVKVCGITRVEDAMAAAQSGANLIGLIFAEGSKRKIELTQAKEIVAAIRRFGERTARVELDIPAFPGSGEPSLEQWYSGWAKQIETKSKRTPLVTGVFQNQPVEEVRRIAEEVGLDLVQLHGDESDEDCLECGVPAIKVVHIPLESNRAGERAAEILSSLRPGYSVALLLDTFVGIKKGGTGEKFDWGVARALQGAGVPVLVAGGLKPNNIDNIKDSIRPWGVDVSSGVELEPGVKDHDAVKQFISRSKR